LDAVIKVGGSLTEQPPKLNALCVELSQIAKKHAIVVVPGGGKFADGVRELDAKFGLPAKEAHELAILAMDQYGMFLSKLIPDCVACSALQEAKQLVKSGKVAVFLPSKLLKKHDPFVPSWDVTSDSIAAYIAIKLKAAKVIFATDVDGIFTHDPKKSFNAKVLGEVSADELLRIGHRTSVDKFLPSFLKQHPIDSYVVNGCFPERITQILSGEPVICTRISVS
jgi:5-(aminomethyl)-3-furanmethanol phosphate kinase